MDIISPTDLMRAKEPPHSIEAEMSLLGAIILANDRIPEVAEAVSPEDFYRPAHAAIFRAIVDLYLGRQECEGVTLKTELERRGELERTGGTAYLAELISCVPSTANAPAYAAIVREKAVLRSLTRACRDVLCEVEAGRENTDHLLDKAQSLIFQIAARRGQKSLSTIGDLLQTTFAEIQSYRDRKQRLLGLSTGFSDLDDITSGLQQPLLYVVAGRPSMGKTSLALRLIEHVAIVERKPVLFFSLEMAGPHIAQQMLCSISRVDAHRMRTGTLSAEDEKRLVDGSGPLGVAPLIIDDTPDLSPLELRARARRLKAEKGIALVVVDYLQRMHARGAENRQQEIAMISSSLKTLAKELEVPVVALAQLNRSPEGRENRRPVLSDLRESGAIEQDADVVMLLYREDYYDPDTTRKNICDLIVAKNRMGPTDTLELAFLKQYTRFENLSPQSVAKAS